MTLKELREKLAAKQANLQAVFGAAKNDQGEYDFKQVPAELIKSNLGDGLATTVQIVEKINELDAELNDLGQQAEALEGAEKAAHDLEARQKAISRPPHFGGGNGGGSGNNPNENMGMKSLGEMIAKDDRYEKYAKAGAAGGISFELDQVFAFDLLAKAGRIDTMGSKATFETGAGWAPESFRRPGFVESAVRPVQLIDIFPTGQTGTDQIKYMEETTRSWQQVADFLPGYQFIKAVDTGASTTNAYSMETSPRMPVGGGNSQSLVTFIVPHTNTSDNVTVAFDDAAPLRIRVSSGEYAASGELPAGHSVIGTVVNDEFQITAGRGQKGDKGDKGDGLFIDESGNTAGRDAFDGEAKGFVYLNTETHQIFRKESAANADWSNGVGFDPGADALYTPDHPNAVEKSLHYIIDRVLTPSLFKSTDPGVGEDADSIIAASQASRNNGDPRGVHFDGYSYNIGKPLPLYTGVLHKGVARQGSRLLATSAMAEMFKFDDQSGATAYFRAGMSNMWLDGAGLVVNGSELIALRHGEFDKVHTSGFTGNAWVFDGPAYYNIFDQCTDASPGRSFLFLNTLALGSNENHIKDFRKNGGTDFMFVISSAANINSLKVRDCMVEAHTGHAIYLDGNPNFGVFNTLISGLRVDSTVVGSKSVTINDANVFDTVLEDIYVEGATTDPTNNGTRTIFRGALYHKVFDPQVTFPTITPTSGSFVDVTVPGVIPGRWRADAYVSSGALSQSVRLDCRVVSNNTVRVFASVSQGSVTPPQVQIYGVAKRLF